MVHSSPTSRTPQAAAEHLNSISLYNALNDRIRNLLLQYDVRYARKSNPIAPTMPLTPRRKCGAMQ